MIGEILMVLWLLVLVPVGVMVTGAVIAAGLGWALHRNGETVHEGSELIEIND